MADSDNSITLPAVIYPTEDASIALLGCWRGAKGRVDALGGKIDAFERLGLRGTGPAADRRSAVDVNLATRGQRAFDESPRYKRLRNAEFAAMFAEDSLIDLLPLVGAGSVEGVIAKLEIIVGADGLIEDPDAFPFPQIRSVLADLRRLAGKSGGFATETG